MKRPSRSEISRVLSHALRHAPEDYGLELDPEGWAPVGDVIHALRRMGREWEAVDGTLLHEVVDTAAKKRHQMRDGRIRAVHGHSMSVVPESETDEPPHVLFHGTSRATVGAILAGGILPMQRQFVHLAETEEQARQVGLRKDTAPVILSIDTGAAASEGITFRRSASGVWLAASIPSSAVAAPDDADKGAGK